ncbi:molybdopterin-dependent oxidoreductase [Streptomyces sp. NRRL F-5126]|uniref:molybdopterin-dependent oxidoreductase n=1 Tax=Streptomyces sp. NRRL F-5126 TaxID=1463857 RepID=UPI00099D2D65|nr:molybdopterin-dependent oxidoreductase [Streptomyces sp. NRRL F-5126]
MSRVVPPRTTDSPAGDRAPTALVLGGEVARTMTLTVADLRAGWRQHRVEVTFDCATSGVRHHTFEGPLLREVAADAGPAFDARRRKDRCHFLLTVTGLDGHHTVLTWAEMDPDFGGAPIVLATRMDGTDLDVAGSQLVVSTDRCGARYVSRITRIWIGRCTAGQCEPPTARGRRSRESAAVLSP